MSLMGAFDIGTTGLVAQALRLNVTASNVANVESVAGPDGRTYRARQVMFRPVQLSGAKGVGVEVSNIVESSEPLKMDYKPGHPLANEDGYVQLPNVNAVEEMVNMISASRSYQANVDMMNTTRQLMLKTLDLGR